MWGHRNGHSCNWPPKRGTWLVQKIANNCTIFNTTISVKRIHRDRTIAGECATVVDWSYTGKVDLRYRTRGLGLHFLALPRTAYAEVLSSEFGPAEGATAPELVQKGGRRKGQRRRSWELRVSVCLYKMDAALGWDWKSHVCPAVLFSIAPSAKFKFLGNCRDKSPWYPCISYSFCYKLYLTSCRCIGTSCSPCIMSSRVISPDTEGRSQCLCRPQLFCF